MPTPPTTRRRRRAIPLGVVVGALASLAAHAAAAWTMWRAAHEPRIGLDSGASDAEFVELPPVETPPPSAPVERETPPSNTPDVRTAPTGVRVRRPSALPHLSLASFDESTGPFGLRDRLTIGRLDPHVIPVIHRSPLRPPEPPSETETPILEPSDETPPDADPETTAPPEPPELEADATAPTELETPPVANDSPPTPETTATVTEDPRVLRPAVLAEDSVRLELPTTPGSPVTEGALDAIASVQMRRALGLDDASLRRALRVRPRGTGSVVTAFATTLEATELRARLEAALRASGTEPSVVDRDGTFSTTVVVDGAEHFVVIDGGTVVVSDAGAERLAGQAVARVRNARPPEDSSSIPLVAAHLTTRAPAPTLSLDIQLFEPTETEPRTRVRVHATLRPAEEGVDVDPVSVDAVVAYARETVFPDATFELSSPAAQVGQQISFEAFVGNVDVGTLAASLTRAR